MDAFCWKLESLERDTSDVARVDSFTNSQRHREKLLYGDYYLNILANRQEYLIRHDYQSLYPNSYYMNWNSTNLYYIICVYTICMFKFCINTILSIMQSAFILSVYIQSVFIQSVVIKLYLYKLYLYNLYLYNLYLYSLYLNSSNQMNSYHHHYFVFHFWRSEGGKQSCLSLNLY